jgi:hypothetical protein
MDRLTRSSAARGGDGIAPTAGFCRYFRTNSPALGSVRVATLALINLISGRGLGRKLAGGEQPPEGVVGLFDAIFERHGSVVAEILPDRLIR